MSYVATGDRTATRDEVLAQRRALRALAARHNLGDPRVDATGTIVVHSDAAGYGPLRRYAAAASKLVGVWVNVITDDAPAAGAAAEAL
jgi:hypothetical protein